MGPPHPVSRTDRLGDASAEPHREDGRRRAAALYREHGGEALLGVAAPAGA